MPKMYGAEVQAWAVRMVQDPLADHESIKRLKAENKRLREAQTILRRPPPHSHGGELDPRNR